MDDELKCSEYSAVSLRTLWLKKDTRLGNVIHKTYEHTLCELCGCLFLTQSTRSSQMLLMTKKCSEDFVVEITKGYVLSKFLQALDLS